MVTDDARSKLGVLAHALSLPPLDDPRREPGGVGWGRLAQMIANLIHSGVFEGYLPSSRQIASLTGDSEATVRRAHKELVGRGLITMAHAKPPRIVASGVSTMDEALALLTKITVELNHLESMLKHIHSNYESQFENLVKHQENSEESLEVVS
jgi:DNA-binding transcriptional regulator YhcF (GntR family)